MTITLVDSSSPQDAVERVIALCESGEVMNLVLSLTIPLPGTEDSFLRNYVDAAKDMQNKKRPPKLHFSHGEYMHKHGDAIEYISEELKKKPTSNRACISLVDTAPILASGDGALPSFMLLQVGFDNTRSETLVMTAYYRALEVTGFLPINIAEMCLIGQEISRSIPAISSINLTMHAFRAHIVKGFRVHTRSSIDIATPEEIREWVKDNDSQKLAELLIDKSRPETIIEDSGLANLKMEIEAAAWSADIRRALDEAILLQVELRTRRLNDSHTSSINAYQERLTSKLEETANLIRSH